MDILPVKFSTYARALPPQPIRLANPPWGEVEPTSGLMLPFIKSSKYGLELLYPYDKECQIIGTKGTMSIEWDFPKEQGVTGGEFRAFSPLHAARYYLINTRLDLQAPPGYVVRTAPHPRFFTDDTGTVPLAMIGHLQNEWYPRLMFLVFRGPRQGKRHIFRKGEPFAQILFVPRHMEHEKISSAQGHTASPAQPTEILPQAVKLTHHPIRMTNVTWGGSPEKKVNGSEPQPWHCLPFVEGSTYGLELQFPFGSECQVINDDGPTRFEGDLAQDGAFAAMEDARFYRLHAQVDLEPPAGYACRIEPHPRFFTDNDGSVPLPVIGHVPGTEQTGAWDIIFRSPRPGERHVFRKDEPFAQVIFVPDPVTYAIERMTLEEAAERRELEDAIESSRLEIADNVWRNPAGFASGNHYAVLARAFARAGLPGVEEVVKKTVEARERSIPKNLTIPEYLALGMQRIREQKFEQAEQLLTDIISRDPNNARAHNALGVCYDSIGNTMSALRAMAQAVILQPGSANFHANLGEMQRRLGLFKESEASFRSALFITPADAEILYALGLVLDHQGRQAEALQAYRAAVATGSPIPQAHHGMGVIFAQQGNLAEARGSFEAALAVAPNYAPARQALQNMSMN